MNLAIHELGHALHFQHGLNMQRKWLADLENRYDEIGQRYPQNYGWYQSRWHSSAADIYDAAVRTSLRPCLILVSGQNLEQYP